MKIVQVIPKSGEVRLKALLNAKERELRSRPTAFRREKSGVWKHVKYPGKIRWDAGTGGILFAEINTGGKPDWQLTNSFLGYLDRHLGDHIDSITITYR